MGSNAAALRARWGEKTIDERFWPKVDKNGPSVEGRPELGACWLWTAANDGRYGYGAFRLNGKTLKASRVAFSLAHGPIPDGMHVCHHCDRPACCNPSHLFLGTRRDNMTDSARKGRAYNVGANHRGERHGMAKLTAAQVQAIRFSVEPVAVVSAQFGISMSHVSSIRTGRSWRSLDVQAAAD